MFYIKIKSRARRHSRIMRFSRRFVARIGMLEIGRAFTQSSLFGNSSAVFSSCQRYRYRLDRIWDAALPPLAFGMLNPSTADHERNDPTIERCERRARAMGFGRLIVWNLFAYRATDPKILKKQPDPVGPDNDNFISDVLVETRKQQGKIVVGWGTHGVLLNRNSQILEIARALSVELYCLGTTNAGQPKHPLYVPYQQELASWA